MSISLLVMPWLLFQSAGHFDTSRVKPPGPTYRFLLVGSWPYLPVPAPGMTGPSAAVVVGPPLADAVVAGDPVVAADPAAAVVAAAAAAGAAVVAAAPLLLSLPHAAATTPNDTSSAVGATHRYFVTQSPDVRRHTSGCRRERGARL